VPSPNQDNALSFCRRARPAQAPVASNPNSSVAARSPPRRRRVPRTKGRLHGSASAPPIVADVSALVWAVKKRAPQTSRQGRICVAILVALARRPRPPSQDRPIRPGGDVHGRRNQRARWRRPAMSPRSLWVVASDWFPPLPRAAALLGCCVCLTPSGLRFQLRRHGRHGFRSGQISSLGPRILDDGDLRCDVALDIPAAYPLLAAPLLAASFPRRTVSFFPIMILFGPLACVRLHPPAGAGGPGW